MYKIYFGDHALWIVSDETNALAQSRRAFLVRYNAEQYHLLNSYIALLTQPQADSPDAVILQTSNPDTLFYTVSQMFLIQEAAGGLVYNSDKEILAIYRRGFWDLPKGKIDAGETPAQAAVREVEEETSVKELQLLDFVGNTYHVFNDKSGKRILKNTHWFAMSAPQQTLKPQAEEDIEQAVWLLPEKLMLKRPIYASILDVLHKKHATL